MPIFAQVKVNLHFNVDVTGTTKQKHSAFSKVGKINSFKAYMQEN